MIPNKNYVLGKGFHTSGKCRVKREFKDVVDVNNIVNRYVKHGVMPELRKSGMYADVSKYGDYAECLAKVEKGNELFSSLPSEIRNRFNGNPQEMIDFLNNPENREEMIKLGFLDKKARKELKSSEKSVETAKKPVSEDKKAPKTTEE